MARQSIIEKSGLRNRVARLQTRLVVVAVGLALLFPCLGRSQEDREGAVYVITAPTASLYLSPSESRKTGAALKRGRRIQAAGPEENGFIPLATKSGQRAWIHVSDVTPEVSSGASGSDDVVEPTARKRSSRGSASSALGLERISFDLGLSAGNYGNLNYTEVDLGLNLYFKEWLAWRNAVFGRFASGLDNIYGLDTSVRGILNLDGGVAGVTAFAGPGYRFVSRGDGAPFGEAGVVFRLAGISLGGGIKTVMNSWVRAGAPNDTQYFFILAGGGSL